MNCVFGSTVSQREKIRQLASLVRPSSDDVSLSGLRLDIVDDKYFFFSKELCLTVLYAPEFTYRDEELRSETLEFAYLKSVSAAYFLLYTPQLLFLKVQMFSNVSSFAPVVQNLAHLDLSYAHCLSEVCLDGCPALEYLKISNSRLRCVNLSRACRLRYVVLRSGLLSSVYGLLFCKRLTELWLDQNQLRELPNLYALENLRVLTIDDNQFEFLDFSALQRLQRLSYLRNPLKFQARIPYSLNMCNRTYAHLPAFPDALFCLRELKHAIMRDPTLRDIYELVMQRKELYRELKRILDFISV